MNRLSKHAAALAGAIPLLLAAAATPALAGGNGHFIKSATSASMSGSSVVVSFKEAGLASGSKETITVSATAATTYECVNGGGKNPSAANKHTYSVGVSKSGTFTADKNGNVVGSQTLAAPTAASLGFSCPSGQTVTFVSVSYPGITLTDSTSGATATFSGPYSYTNPSAPAVR